jgi:hypothetical protein
VSAVLLHRSSRIRHKQDTAHAGHGLHRTHRTRPGERNGRREGEGDLTWLVIARNLIARN